MERTALALTLEILKAMAQLELAVARLYKLLAEPEGEAREFWSRLEQEELQHTHNIQRMAEIIAARPDRFESQRSFSIVAIQTFIAYVESNIRRLHTNEIPRTDQRRLLTIARDVEQSILEGKYAEIVKTDDAEFQALMRGVLSETDAHRARIVARLAALSKPA